MQIQLPIRNFQKQQQIFDCPNRFVIVPKGRQFGATKGAANHLIGMAMKHQFARCLWVDTVNANIDKYVERYFIPTLRKISRYPQYATWWNWRKQQRILEMGQSAIDFRSADKPENIEGFNYDWAFLNEAGIILRDDYLWDNAIRPMLWRHKAHTIIAGTPKGKGKFYELYQRGIDPDQTDYAAMRFSTFDNPYLPIEEIRKEMAAIPQRVISQEIYAEFLEDTGVVFTGVEKVAVIDTSAPTSEKPLLPGHMYNPDWFEPQIGHTYVIGADIARLQDYTVIAVYDRENNRQVFQMRFNDLEWPTILMRVKAVSQKYNNALVYLDSTGVGEPVYEDLARQRVPVEPIHFTNTMKKDLIDKLANWIELRYIQMLNLKETIDELNIFTYDISERSGLVRYNAPVGFHDDIVIAHALAIWGLQPVIREKQQEELGILQEDILWKTGQLGELFEDQFEEVEDWEGPSEDN